MRAVVQRVKSGSVLVDQEILAQIKRGLVVFLGVSKDDNEEDAKLIAEKLANLRIFDDSEGKLNLSLREVGGEVLIVSQFTLYGDCRKGHRPSFDQAAYPKKALPLYQKVINLLSAQGLGVKEGTFGKKMLVKIDNDGPVTLLLDSKKIF